MIRDAISAFSTIVAIGAIVMAVASGPAAGFELISPQEAALPDAPDVGAQLGWRSVARAPRVVVLSPAPDAGQVRSPVDLRLRFEAHSGAVIDQRSLKVTYLKMPMINLTPRISDWIKAGGVDLLGAEIPPGKHYLKVEIKDSAGRRGAIEFALLVGG